MLTSTQQALVKADIIAQGDLSVFPNIPDGNSAIADLYNLPASPQWVVWRSDVPTSDVKKAMDWVEVLALGTNDLLTWQFMLSNGIIAASDTNVRAGIAEIFKGPQGVNTRTALLEIAKRDASRIEKLLSTGTGTTVSPATMGFEGTISLQDVQAARDS